VRKSLTLDSAIDSHTSFAFAATGQVLRRLLAAFALLVGWGLCAAQSTYPGSSWSRLAQAQSAWSASALQEADRIAATLQTDTYLVVHRGAIVHSFGDIATPRNIYSGRKSILSLLIGMSVDRGLIDLDQSLASLSIDDVQGLSEQEKTATVRQLMQGRSGIFHEAAYETPDMKAARPARGSHPPGTFWYYNNWDFNALGTIFQQRTGKSVFEALQGDLAAPLQFEDFNLAAHTQWVKEPVSQHPAYVMKLSARDLARVGVLMARSGRWGERQLVSPQWVAESTKPYSTAGARWQSYGYMWWIPNRAWPFWTRTEGDVFFAQGSFGQFLLVDRRRDLVIVHQAERRLLFSNPVHDGTISPLLARILAAMPQE
jgi:CubicO group peptidase (beta-lactamase class C family)